jgi:hypothetical protein
MRRLIGVLGSLRKILEVQILGSTRGIPPVFFQRVRKAIVLFGLWIYGFRECGGY